MKTRSWSSTPKTNTLDEIRNTQLSHRHRGQYHGNVWVVERPFGSTSAVVEYKRETGAKAAAGVYAAETYRQ